VSGIGRFFAAQDGGEFEAALAEITSGQKAGHWIWYVFPQLAGLGLSRMSQAYGIRDRAEAVEYLHDPILRSRLETITATAAKHIRAGVPIERLMGSGIDATKLVSSLTLFGTVARELETQGEQLFAPLAKLADEILTAAESQGYPRCRYTLERLAGG
jgi:uncharacterized protein (DUF1810 family)